MLLTSIDEVVTNTSTRVRRTFAVINNKELKVFLLPLFLFPLPFLLFLFSTSSGIGNRAQIPGFRTL